MHSIRSTNTNSNGNGNQLFSSSLQPNAYKQKKLQESMLSSAVGSRTFNNSCKAQSSTFGGKGLFSKFLRLNTETEKFHPDVKIKPFLVFNKIQQQKHNTTMGTNFTHKQLAYDVLIETKIPKKRQLENSTATTSTDNKQQEDQKGLKGCTTAITNENPTFDTSQKIESQKIKDCISANRSNSQIYKRVSKHFQQNLKNGTDQLYFFSGLQTAARVETSIGNEKNPGMFMIMAIGILDQKYKEHQQRFDVEISFMEMRNNCLYDLLNYTQDPLSLMVERNYNNRQGKKDSSGRSKGREYFQNRGVQYNEHSVKICTFLQFIKLFRIALFNNKDRDFKSAAKNDRKIYGSSDAEMIKSTFMMKIKTKVYNSEDDLIKEQETLMIDYDENCYMRSNGAIVQEGQKVSNSENSCGMIERKGNELRKKETINKLTDKYRQPQKEKNVKSLFDYVLVEIHNSNPENKPIHYHMVEKNCLIQLIRRFLRKSPRVDNIENNLQKGSLLPYRDRQKAKNFNHQVGGQIFMINSFSTNEVNFNENRKYLQSILDCQGSEWIGCVKNRPRFASFFNVGYAESVLDRIRESVKNKKYSSLRDLYAVKEYYTKEIEQVLKSMKNYKKIVCSYMRGKRQLKYEQNMMVGFQLQLIGGCVKSDNFKDFYKSKGYITLDREVSIKTEPIKQLISKLNKELLTLQERFVAVRKGERHRERNQRLLNPAPQVLLGGEVATKTSTQTNVAMEGTVYQTANLEIVTATKFKLLKGETGRVYSQFRELEEFLNLRRYITEYLHDTWHKQLFTSERTIAEEIIFEETFTQEISRLKELLERFQKSLTRISDGSICCEKGNGKQLAMDGLTQLMRSINKSQRGLLKQEPKKSGKAPLCMTKASSQIYPKSMSMAVLMSHSHLKGQKEVSSMRGKENCLPMLNASKNRLNETFNLSRNKKDGVVESSGRKVYEIKGKLDFESMMMIGLEALDSTAF